MNSSRGIAPVNSTDCHAHIFDPARFPYSPARLYTPPPATASSLMQMHASLGVHRVVLVQPSVYGTNNACLLDALRQWGDRARGIAVVDGTFSRAQLADMHGAGIRGVRVNLEVSRHADAPDALHRLRATLDTLDDSSLLIQVYAALPMIVACAPLLCGAGRAVLIDHFGLAKATGGTRQPGFDALIDLMASPNIWMKLSGPYQISGAGPTYTDIAPVAKAFITASPHRVVWGSDWPHTGGSNRATSCRPTELEPFRLENDCHNFGLIWDWATEASGVERLLVANPARLFGFGAH